jgi:hypothetical protein
MQSFLHQTVSILNKRERQNNEKFGTRPVRIQFNLDLRFPPVRHIKRYRRDISCSSADRLCDFCSSRGVGSTTERTTGRPGKSFTGRNVVAAEHRRTGKFDCSVSIAVILDDA